MIRRAAILGVIAAAAASQSAHAQTAIGDECIGVDTTPGASLEPAPPKGTLQTPIPWTEFVVEGKLVDPPDVVHALFLPTLAQHRTDLSAATIPGVARAIAKFGYQLLGQSTRDVANGVQLVLRVEPLPLVHNVDVHVEYEGWTGGLFDKLLDEEIRRRMRTRIGSYLPSDAKRRACALAEDQARIDDYLHDEGYFDAAAELPSAAIDGTTVKVHVGIKLGAEYHIGKVTIVNAAGNAPLAVSNKDIEAKLHHRPCMGAGLICLPSESRFTRTQHEEDREAIKQLFQKRGYPAVRVESSLNDPELARTAFDRRTQKVNVRLTIDERRHLDIKFEGPSHDAFPEEQLRDQLTFNKAQSIDDVEAQSSANALVTYMQVRGYFDARVTWARDRLDELDFLTFHLDPGKVRQLQAVSFEGNTKCASDDDRCRSSPEFRELSDDALSDIIATKAYTVKADILGTQTQATSVELAGDVDRIREYYRRAGFREAQVGVSAAPGCAGDDDHARECALDNAALTAALVASGVGDDLYVRFSIAPGERTMLTRVELEPADDDAHKQLANGLCDAMLKELSARLATRQARDPARAIATRAPGDACAALAVGLPFREDDVAATKDQLRDFLFKQGRPRAEVTYEARVVGPHRVEAHYRVRTAEERRIGKVVIRGAFRTSPSIIFGELRFHEGQLLTADALADGARRLRNTGLFDAVNIDLPDLATDSVSVNAIVRVQERYWYRADIDVAGGASSYQGIFVTVGWTQGNLFGVGAQLRISGTYGDKLKDAEATFRLPQYLIHLVRWLPDFQADLTGLIRQQDTPAFGLLTTEALTVGGTRLWSRQRTAAHRARATSFGLHYDFRLRTRNVDALRPIGADVDAAQVAISTRTGSFGATFDIDQRVDRAGQLSPLAAADGYHIGATISYAALWLGGQDTFAKASLTASKFFALGENLVIRADFRYDEGFPLGGAALLPEVERFFAGGDNTVRGYQDDRMATELVQVAVPPLANLSQIRVIPAGGNIRLLSSVDAQYRIWKVFAGALFSDAGMISNQWSSVTQDSIRPSIGAGLRVLSPFGIGAVEYAVPIHPQLGDDPRGRYHIYFAARAQF